ncbi:integrase [Thermofilum sp.]|uniref:integrase n=1 Tax=Thermofilum sp. TaxID=1961369 RepID=UPI00316AB4EA
MSWRELVNTEALGSVSKRRLLELLKEKLGFEKTCEVLGLSKTTLYRYLAGERDIPASIVKTVLEYLSEDEFRNAVGKTELLRVLGVLRHDGTIDYSLALELIQLALRDPYLKQIILRTVVQRYREDLRRMLGASLPGVRLEWSSDFEEFLKEHKKRRRVRDPETLAYYKSLFKKHLEGKELSEELVSYVVNHPNKWLRNVFRHYVQYLFYKRVIDPETWGWLIEVVPSRRYRLDVRPYQITLEDVRKTLNFLREHHELYYVLYRLMLESGARFEHVLEMLRSWSPGKMVFIESIELETEKLVCFEDRGFCRYYLGLRGHQKPCEWLYLSINTLKQIEEHAPIEISRHAVRKYAKRHGLLLPKMMRKVAWRLMIQVIPREVARFIQSRFGELKISEARYEDLLSEADEYYSRYLEKLREVEKDSG